MTASTPHFPSRLHLHRHDLNASDWLPGSLVSMAAVPPLTPRRGTQPSHLRRVSNGSSSNNRPLSAAPSESGTVHRIPVPVKPPIERVCVLWNHDEGFFKDEVVINLDLFPDVKAGELLAITASKTDARDFQDKAQISKKDVENVANALQRERSNSNPRSPGRINDAHPKHDVDLGKRYLFIAKDMTKDMKAKQPTLQVSVAKHIADLFCLKNRSNVRITMVSILA